MPLPRAPKINRTPLAAEASPDWRETLSEQDPYALGPDTPWLRIIQPRVPEPARLERADGDGWVTMGEGVFRIHAYLAPDRALVSIDQERMVELRADGSEVVIFEGPRLVLSHGGLWGDNWMFAAAALPGGRWIGALPHTEDSSRGPKNWLQELVLFSRDHERIASLPLPERTDSAVRKGHRRRFVARQLFPALAGRVVLLPDVEVLAVGVYADRLDWIGKTTMHSEGGVFVDGEQAFVSSSLANTKVNWARLEGLEALFQKKR